MLYSTTNIQLSMYILQQNHIYIRLKLPLTAQTDTFMYQTTNSLLNMIQPKFNAIFIDFFIRIDMF